MVQRLYSFLVVCLLMFYGEIFGQKKPQKGIGFPGITSFNKNPVPSRSAFGTSLFIKYDDRTGFNKYQLLNMPAASFYTGHLGFICKKEWQLEKITSVPFRFRLGSLEYVNYLEQKPNAIKPRL